MSKKTQNIYEALENLEKLQTQLAQYSKENESRELDDIQFNMNQNLKNLRFWITSLYAYNGKSTSRAKQNSSRENGKKGGRPPKAVTLLKRRRLEIESQLPEINRKLVLTNDSSEEALLLQQKQSLEAELKEIETRLENV